ncbi:MAG: hypothetical protein JWN00_4818 [Actinomycetia bacterium]|nr:hypothetical protein [Actinomycetes bacterium]
MKSFMSAATVVLVTGVALAGTRLFGAGGAVLGGHGHIRLEFYPFDDLKGMNALGWAAKSTVVCAN